MIDPFPHANERAMTDMSNRNSFSGPLTFPATAISLPVCLEETMRQDLAWTRATTERSMSASGINGRARYLHGTNNMQKPTVVLLVQRHIIYQQSTVRPKLPHTPYSNENSPLGRFSLCYRVKGSESVLDQTLDLWQEKETRNM